MELKIKIPESLSEITLGQYQKFFAISKDFEDGDDTIFLQQKMIQIFCKVELSLVAQIQYKDVIEIVNKLNALFTQGDKFINRFEMDGVEYGFISNLDEISFGEYSNLDEYITDFDMMHKACAVMYRPIKSKQKNGKYLIEDYNGTSMYCEKMRDMPLNIVFGALVFFWNLSNELLIATKNYFAENPQVRGMIAEANSQKNGDGTHHSTPSLEESLSISIQPLNFQFTRL